MKASITSVAWTFLAIILTTILFLGFTFSPTTSRLTIDLVKAIVSWPMAITCLTISFGYSFKKEISGLISRIRQIGSPSGYSVTLDGQREDISNKETQTTAESKDDDNKLTENFVGVLETLSQIVIDKDTALEQKDKLIEEIKEQAINLINEKDAHIADYRNKYLYYFLAPISRFALRWIDEQVVAEPEELQQELISRGATQEQAKRVHDVLLSTGVVENDGYFLSITDEGVGFLNTIKHPG